MTCFMTCYFDETRLINYTTLITDNVNITSGDRNLIKDSKRVYIMSLVVFDSIRITLYTMLDPEESCKTNLVPRGKRSYGCTLQNQKFLFRD